MKTRKVLARVDEYISESEEETRLIAEKLANGFKGAEIVLLFGELGAGKTVFAKGIAAGLGFEDINSVCSPSYTLVNIYKAKSVMYHVDLYRLGTETEILDLGWEDYIGQGVVVVEWGGKLSFPIDAIRVTIEVQDDETRKITIERQNDM
ncbi:tRNA (adenosine(37)-N6)-threonylcarbamoyltransferase complex ATPase subunit type 1 TsaE [Acidobacteriota bacterium]